MVEVNEPIKTKWPIHSEEEIQAVVDILRAGKTNFWTGREGSAFEQEWSRAVGLPNTIAVNSGTTALECAIRALGVSRVDDTAPGDVLVPARTFVATAAAVVTCGGRPVLADISADSLCVTPETLEAARTPETVGVIIVHWAGLPCPRIDEIVRWAWKHQLWIIEDAAHAQGAPVGRTSHITCWSFCVGKIISTGGEGGAISCLDNNLADRMRAFRDHGRFQMIGGPDPTLFEYKIEAFGSNLRMTEMQSVIGRIQLRGLAAQIARRREIAARYDEVLGWRAMYTPEQRAVHARYLYHVRVAGKREVIRALVERGIPARWGGCPNIGKEPAFAARGWLYDCPVADRMGEEVLALPVYPTMSSEDVDRVCWALKEVI